MYGTVIARYKTLKRQKKLNMKLCTLHFLGYVGVGKMTTVVSVVENQRTKSGNILLDPSVLSMSLQCDDGVMTPS